MTTNSSWRRLILSIGPKLSLFAWPYGLKTALRLPLRLSFLSDHALSSVDPNPLPHRWVSGIFNGRKTILKIMKKRFAEWVIIG
jgi:hypothetical protein